MKSSACPSCGIMTETPHTTAQECIDALQDEIARTREVLEQTKRSPVVARPDVDRENAEVV
jgi:hypothetical protein